MIWEFPGAPLMPVYSDCLVRFSTLFLGSNRKAAKRLTGFSTSIARSFAGKRRMNPLSSSQEQAPRHARTAVMEMVRLKASASEGAAMEIDPQVGINSRHPRECAARRQHASAA